VQNWGGILELRGKTVSFSKLLYRDRSEERGTENKQAEENIRTLTLSGRWETIVRVPVEFEENQTEGIIENANCKRNYFGKLYNNSERRVRAHKHTQHKRTRSYFSRTKNQVRTA
jgi:hypothetical protein